MDLVLALAMAVALGMAVALAWARLRRLDRRALAAAERQRLAATRPGGSPDRPIELRSPAVVEARAAKETCIACGHGLVVEEHTAEATEAGDRRVAHLRCSRCGGRSRLYFRLESPGS